MKLLSCLCQLASPAAVVHHSFRTDVEQGKWDNTRRGVSVIGTFVLFVIFSLEMAPKPKSEPKRKPKSEEHDDHPQNKATDSLTDAPSPEGV